MVGLSSVITSKFYIYNTVCDIVGMQSLCTFGGVGWQELGFENMHTTIGMHGPLVAMHLLGLRAQFGFLTQGGISNASLKLMLLTLP